MKSNKEDKIEKAEFEIEFETVGYITRNDMGRLKGGDDETGTGVGAANTCTDRNTNVLRTCIPKGDD